MKKLLFFVKILIIAALLTWALRKFNGESAQAVLASADLRWGLLALLFTALAYSVTVFRWRIIIRDIWSSPRASFRRLCLYNLLSVFYPIFIPTSIAGEAVRAYKLAKDEDNDYAGATISVAIDRIIGMATWLALFLLTPTPIRKNYWWFLLLIIPVVLVIFRKKIVLGERRLIDFSRHHPKDLLKATAVSLASQFVFIASAYAIFRCFSLSISPLEAAGLVSTATMAGAIPISFLGVGLREGTYVALLPLAGATSTQALLITSFFVLTTYLFGIAGGLIELAHTGWSFSKLKLPEGEIRQRETQDARDGQ